MTQAATDVVRPLVEPLQKKERAYVKETGAQVLSIDIINSRAKPSRLWTAAPETDRQTQADSGEEKSIEALFLNPIFIIISKSYLNSFLCLFLRFDF